MSISSFNIAKVPPGELQKEDFSSPLVSALRERFQYYLDNYQEYAKKYQSAEPFDNIYIDNFLPEEVANILANQFPVKNDSRWVKLPTEDQHQKFVIADENSLPSNIRDCITELNSGTFIRFLELLSGIKDLIPDPKMAGGGLHRIEKGGKLSVHVDFSHHPTNP